MGALVRPTRGHTRGPTRGVKFRSLRALCLSDPVQPLLKKWRELEEIVEENANTQHINDILWDCPRITPGFSGGFVYRFSSPLLGTPPLKTRHRF